MDRHELQNALFKIDGYFYMTKEGPHHALDRAKAELLAHLKKDIANIEAITLEQFNERKKYL